MHGTLRGALWPQLSALLITRHPWEGKPVRRPGKSFSIECAVAYLYIQDMGIAIVLALLQPLPQADTGIDFITVIDRMDREMSGLLDAYLEAVPECPVREDTPVRIWLMDLAWLRASGTVRESSGIRLYLSGDLLAAWQTYLKNSSRYLTLFRSVRDVYNRDDLPDSSLSLELETQLMDMDSLWHESEALLLNIYAEEDPR
jgi:hypothetical protein